MRTNNSNILRLFLSRISILLAVGLLVSAICYGQTIIKNPKQPSNPEVGRTVKLLDQMRIRDDGESIVFKYPYQLQIGDDGSVHFVNAFEHFKYDSQGRFVYKIVRSGQGPGEAQSATRAC